jgi:acyl-CoA synthetase (AMP-forming)/AMP-acid ligase II
VNVRPPFPDIAFRPTLPVLLHQAVDQYGDDDFVVMADRRISFAQADAASASMARELLAAGVGKGTRIGIILPTGIDWAVAWLAAARIGAMPMLFPATYRPRELQRALRISDASVLFAGPTLLGKDFESFLEEAIPSLATSQGGPLRDPTVPYLRSIWMVGGSNRAWSTSVSIDTDPTSDFSDEFLAAVEAEVSPADPLLAIYTSGSSADPKAVVHTHGGAIRKMPPELGVCLAASRGGRTYCAMPFFWVGGPQLLLGALLSGAAVVTQERFEPGGALELLERERCTSITGWATVIQQLRQHPSFPTRDLSALVLPTARATPMVSTKGDPINMGMTETFGPHANREWFDYMIVDRETGEPLADGEEGEFCVRGFGLMAGLYKKEREETFDANGYYHTGDRGYIENGRIFFRGRYSEMVKSAGANVSPLEVENVLQSFPDVKMAFVLGLPDPERGEIVGAVIVPEGADLDVQEVRERVNKELSAYKVPVRWQVLDEGDVPWLASGKIDKRTLREQFT